MVTRIKLYQEFAHTKTSTCVWNFQSETNVNLVQNELETINQHDSHAIFGLHVWWNNFFFVFGAF